MRRVLLAILLLVGSAIGTLAVYPMRVSAQVSPPAAENPDINLRIRGWERASPTLGSNSLIDVSGETDLGAPQLSTLLSGNASPTITSLYQVNDWNWQTNSNAGPIAPDNSTNWGVTLSGLATSPGQNILVPYSGYDLGGGYQAVVLYASPTSITIHYTPDDNVVVGYTVHLENFSVDPDLLAKYQQSDAAGRGQLVALTGGSTVGHASGNEILVATRDTGTFMDPRSRKDWWHQPAAKSPIQPAKLIAVSAQKNSKKSQGTSFLRSYNDESEEPCPYNEGALNQQDPNKPYQYRQDLISPPIPEMRGDAGLNFNTGVRGSHCGQAKSTPINLEEVAPYQLLEIPQCMGSPPNLVSWAGEIEFNYAAPPEVNFRLPFAQEMADQWAGTWDAEHVKESEMTSKEDLAYGPTGTPAATLLREQAKSEIEQRRGMLKKLLSPQQQDKLKCDFINYVKKQGAGSMYANFSVDGTRFADIPCAPTVTNPSLTYDSPEYQKWYDQWGKTWHKLALYPNERATGQLSFLVCGDRKYYMNQAFPEVMRLGLSANSLFQMFTSKTQQDSFYGSGFPDLRDPLNSKILLGDNSTAGITLSFVPTPTFLGKVGDKGPAVLSAASSLVTSEKHNIAAGLTNLVTLISGGAGQVPPKLLALGAGKLLAQDQGCMPIATTVDVVNSDPNNFVYELVISRTSCAPPGVLGDLQIDPPTNYEDARRAQGLPVGPHVQSMVVNELRYLSNYEGADTFMPQVRSSAELAQYQWNINCDRFPEGSKCHGVKASFQGAVAPALGPAGGCDPTKGACQCTETPTCTYSDPTARAQLGPSDTEVWQKHDNHILLGVDWSDFVSGKRGNARSDPGDQVKLQWRVPAWKPGQRPIPDGNCEIVAKDTNPACNGETILDKDNNCRDAGFDACNETKGRCGNIFCTKVHERVVDVYNSVPFLASAWRQLAGTTLNQASGIFNTWKPYVNPSVTGKSQTTPYGCSDDPNVVFDSQGNFVPNPGASDVMWGFSQSFGVGTEQQGFDFGQSKVKVRMTRPADGTKSKISFYRLGGLCNANLWLWNSDLFPFMLKLGNAAASVGAPTPNSSRTTQLLAAPQVPAIAAEVSSLVPSLPKTETPTIATVTNAGNLTSQPALASVQNGDQILVYPKAREVVVFRPSTKTIVATMPTISFALRNGTTEATALDKFAAKLTQLVPQAVVTERGDAQKHDYAKTQIIDPTEVKGPEAATLAVTLGTGISHLPGGERGTSADYLIIVGSDVLK